MKYISVVIFFVLLEWTWCLATSPRNFTLDHFHQVEVGAEQDIKNFILRKYPSTSQINCPQLYSENIEAGTEMIVRFRCNAVGEIQKDQPNPATPSEDIVSQIFEGYLHLKSNDHFQTWSEIGGEIKAPKITFEKGIEVHPEADPEQDRSDSSENQEHQENDDE